MQRNQRREERITLKEQPKGKFHLYVGERRINVLKVVDISPMGIRIEVDTPLDKAVGVRLRYEDAAIDLQVNGVIVWRSSIDELTTSATGSRTYLLGINLISPTLLHAFM